MYITHSQWCEISPKQGDRMHSQLYVSGRWQFTRHIAVVMYFTSGSVPQYGIDYISIN